MSALPTDAQIQAALATVLDPEIHRHEPHVVPAHAQWPPEHDSPVLHWVLQSPQKLGSVCVSTSQDGTDAGAPALPAPGSWLGPSWHRRLRWS